MKISLDKREQDRQLLQNIRADELKKLTIGELLEISHLNRSEIEQRVLIVDEIFKEFPEIDKENQAKLLKIKTKLERGNGDRPMGGLINQKYLSPALMLRLSNSLVMNHTQHQKKRKILKLKTKKNFRAEN